MIKIAITGPESTGKSSLTKALADHFQAKWFPEYAREYLTKRDGKYQFKDLKSIAIGQEQRRSVDLKNEQIAFYDTENLVIQIWSEYKYGDVDPKVVDLVRKQDFDHYFLCSPDSIAWEYDPLRENPGERGALFRHYESAIRSYKFPFTILDGERDERIESAIAVTEEILLSKGGYCV